MLPIILNPDNDTFPPEGYIVIDTEVAFLKYAASGKPLFIKGKCLCDWAQKFYECREISFTEVSSPVKRLRENFSDLSEESAHYIIHECLGQRASSLVTFSASEILKTCFPSPIWEATPSIKHAAEWLLWLDETEANPAFLPLFRAITSDWKQKYPKLGEIYSVVEYQDARKMLEMWLGAQITPFIHRFEPFPLSIPDKWIVSLDKSWRTEIVKSEGTFLNDFIKTPLEWRFKYMVAVATLEYFEKHPDSINLTSQMVDQIARFVSGDYSIRLRRIKPVQAPSQVPEEPESVIKWFIDEYLPFRERQYVTNAASDYPKILEIGRQFALWYLDFYPKALMSKRHLSFFKAKQLRDHGTNHVNLLVILDGMHAIDAKYLMDTLLRINGEHRLTLTQNNFCFAPLPTVTDFAKGALIHGVQPTFMQEFELLGVDVSEMQSPVPKMLEAKPGDLLIWRIQDPDRTYHTKNRSPLLKKEIEGQLATIAHKIVEVANSVPITCPLKIIVTTDHGRFLGESKRKIIIPEDMQAHGRAAWGKTDIVFDKCGYLIENDIVFLSKERFGLQSDDAAVILSDCAFRNDVYEQEICPHGGLFPEEVMIPWMVFERNIKKPDLDIKITGEGQAYHSGKATITIVNPSNIDVQILRLELDFGGDKRYPYNLSLDVAGLDHCKLDFELSYWPSSEQKKLGKARVVARMPNGEEFILEPSIDGMEVKELYTRDKSLLEGLDL